MGCLTTARMAPTDLTKPIISNWEAAELYYIENVRSDKYFNKSKTISRCQRWLPKDLPEVYSAVLPPIGGRSSEKKCTESQKQFQLHHVKSAFNSSLSMFRLNKVCEFNRKNADSMCAEEWQWAKGKPYKLLLHLQTVALLMWFQKAHLIQR